jgi:hypothetical protein
LKTHNILNTLNLKRYKTVPALIDAVKVGDDVEVFFNLKGRKWTDKMGKVVYFNTLQLWKLNVLSGGGAASTPEYAPPVDISSAPDDDDLPF